MSEYQEPTQADSQSLKEAYARLLVENGKLKWEVEGLKEIFGVLTMMPAFPNASPDELRKLAAELWERCPLDLVIAEALENIKSGNLTFQLTREKALSTVRSLEKIKKEFGE